MSIVRPTSEDRARFRDECPLYIRAAARAMYARFIELGFRPPYAENDGAWEDLAAVAINASGDCLKNGAPRMQPRDYVPIAPFQRGMFNA